MKIAPEKQYLTSWIKEHTRNNEQNFSITSIQSSTNARETETARKYASSLTRVVTFPMLSDEVLADVKEMAVASM